MAEKKERQRLAQAMVGLWKEEVKKEEERQRVEQVMARLQNTQGAAQLNAEDEEKKRKRIQQMMKKLEKEKAEKAEKRRRKQEAVTKFQRGLAAFFIINTLLVIIGIILAYYFSAIG